VNLWRNAGVLAGCLVRVLAHVGFCIDGDEDVAGTAAGTAAFRILCAAMTATRDLRFRVHAPTFALHADLTRDVQALGRMRPQT
jgi:hypothetical protein